MFNIGIEGLDDLIKGFQQIDKNTEKALKKAVGKGARVVLRAAKAKCPVGDEAYNHQPGNLRRSLKAKVLKPKYPGVVTALIGPEKGKKVKNDGWYGRLVEYGTVKMAPQPFLRPAYDEKKNEAYKEMALVFDELLEGKAIEDFQIILDALGD